MSMKSKRSKNTSAASPATVTADVRDMDSKPIRFLIAGVAMAAIGVFYAMQDLFAVDNLNDFGEYMMRAENWRAGTFTFTGGTDVLLSVVEYLALLVHPHDFMAFYGLAKTLLLVILLGSAYAFIVRNNPVLPDFWVKLGTVLLACSIPHFIMATRTIDQTLLFGACLLLWMATYDIPWAGFIGVLTFLSRPEAVIIVPLTVLLYVIHTERRKQILINAGMFIVLLVAAKLTMQSMTPSQGAGGPQELGFLDKISLDWFTGLLSHIIKIPAVLAMYAMECFQSIGFFILFLIGLIVSARQRSAWLMYAIPVAFLLAYAIMYADSEAKSYSFFTSIIRSMTLEKDYFIVNAFNKFDSQIGHGRYRLALYPALSFFVISALAFIVRRFTRTSARARYTGPAIVASALLCSTLFIGLKYPSVERAYDTKQKVSKLHPVYRIALELRKSAVQDGRIYIAGFCDNSTGSFMNEFGVFSGIREMVARVCPTATFWQKGRAEPLSCQDYIQTHPYNPDAVMVFRDGSVNQEQISDPRLCSVLQRIERELDPSALRDGRVTHVIAGQQIKLPHLHQVANVDGIYCFEVVKGS
ncbi:MAG: hypothetical protein FGM32_08955 [Candidatus Kapabacteria bacterium]|nr:hypothetical protein [Candidatus Kapabacteria bacterium]